MGTKFDLGFIAVVLFSSYFMFELTDSEVRFRVDDDKTTFYCKAACDSTRWTVSGREVNSLWDGSTKMNRRSSQIERTLEIDESTGKATATRYTPYIRDNISITDTYKVDGAISEVEMFPIEHTVRIRNAKGKIYQYEVNTITYDGPTLRLEDRQKMSFGQNMKVEWQEGNYYAKVSQLATRPDKLQIKYRVQTNDETFSVRLFDPVEGGTITVGANTITFNGKPYNCSTQFNTNTSQSEVHCDRCADDGNCDAVCDSGESCTRWDVIGGELSTKSVRLDTGKMVAISED